MVRIFIFLYIVFTILFFTIGDGSVREWQGFDILTLIGAIILFSISTYLELKLAAIDKVWLLYSLGVTSVRFLYTFLCVYAPIAWVYEKTDYFTIGLCVSFICLLIYSANAYES